MKSDITIITLTITKMESPSLATKLPMVRRAMWQERRKQEAVKEERANDSLYNLAEEQIRK